MTGQPGRVGGQVRCPVCGKLRYLSRADARRAARQMPGQVRSRAYRCGEFWHLASWQPAGRVAFYRADR